MQWATLTIAQVEVDQPGAPSGIPSLTHELPINGTAWTDLKTPMIILGVLLIVTNLWSIVSQRSIDQFVPAIANCVTGAVLTLLTAFFIQDPAGALGNVPETSVRKFTETATGGATLALMIALALLAAGAAQLAIRLRSG